MKLFGRHENPPADPVLPDPPEGMEWVVALNVGPFSRTMVYLANQGVPLVWMTADYVRRGLKPITDYSGAEMWRQATSASPYHIVEAARELLEGLWAARATIRSRQNRSKALGEVLGCTVVDSNEQVTQT